MSIINNIGILQNPQAKKAFGKISFEAGEKFSARIVSAGEQQGEVNLKLLDGWQFSAKLDKPLDQENSGSILKFEVEGFEDDKLKIKLVYEDKQDKTSHNDISEDFSNGKLLGNDKRDALLFEKMIKHDMPLTKGNITDIKNLIDFKEKISLDVDKAEVFIAKYLSSRDIDPSSKKANEITKILNSFFEALKQLDVDEILLFKENNIELTKGNLESFTKLFKGESVVYNNIKDINNNILNGDITEEVFKDVEPLEVEQNKNKFVVIDEDDSGKTVDKTQKLDNAMNNKNVKEVVSLINKELKEQGISHRVLSSSLKDLKLDDDNLNSNTLKTLVNKIFKAEGISLTADNHIKLIGKLEEKLNLTHLDISANNLEYTKQEEKLPLNKLEKYVDSEVEQGSKSFANTKTHGYSKTNSLNEIVNMIKKELNISDIDKGTINNAENEVEKVTTESLIKEQIKLKTDEIKNMVKDVIENKLNLKPESYEKVMSVFEQKLNDIKMFNSISEQYYYLDLPINVKENEYQCKLIIKDDRKKGKKIDSKNVKIATSVKTINMGTVDAYIKINNNNMNIDINCEGFWVKVLELGKEKLTKDLSSLKYRVNIEVNEKADEFTLVNCREFFDDRSFNTINIKV